MVNELDELTIFIEFDSHNGAPYFWPCAKLNLENDNQRIEISRIIWEIYLNQSTIDEWNTSGSKTFFYNNQKWKIKLLP